MIVGYFCKKFLGVILESDVFALHINTHKAGEDMVDLC